MRATIFSVVFLLASVSLSAQKNEKRFVYSNITEIGLSALNFEGFSYEATSVHGILLDKKHNLGIGIGFGFNMPQNSNVAYIPLFFNYRFYFKPDKTLSPHVNIAVGGLVAKEGYGVYSSITMGFRIRKFSFSSGLSFTPIYEMIYWTERIREGTDDYPTYSSVKKSKMEWYYPFGFTLKVGFTF